MKYLSLIFLFAAVCIGLLKAESPKCLQPVEVGHCYAAKPRFAYTRENGCSQFTYGGCGGNDNNFMTMEECHKECLVPR